MTTTEPATQPRDLFAFDRWDRLGLRLLLGAVCLASVVALVAAPIAGWLRGDPLAVPFASRVVVPELDAVGLSHGIGDYDLRVRDVTTGQRLLDLIPGVINAALVIGAAYLMLRFLRAVAGGETFAPQQVWRLRGIAGIMVVGAPVVEFARMSCTGALLGSVDLGGLAPALTIPLPWLAIVVGMCVALVAEAFKVGTALRDDVDGLV